MDFKKPNLGQESLERRSDMLLLYKQAVRNSPDLISIVDRSYVYRYINDSYIKRYGKAEHEIVGHHASAILGNEIFEDNIKPHFDRCLSGQEVRYQGWFSYPNWGDRHMDISYYPMKAAGGTVEYITAVIRDITDLKEMESLLRESERKYRALVDLTSDSVYELDKDLRYTYVSERGGDISGRKPEDHIGRTPFDFMTGEEKERVLGFIHDKLFPPQSLKAFENTLIGQHGRLIVMETSAVPIYGAQGQFSGFLCVDHDITERRRAEELLRQSEEKYRTLFEESRDAVYITTPEGKIVEMNPAGVELLGYSSKEELLKVDIARDIYWNPQEREAFQKVIAEQGFVKDYELNLRRKDGQRLIVLVSANSVRDSKGNIVAYRGIMHDVTKRMQLESQLHQSSKLAAIGELASGVAHEINNPLSAIDVQTGLMRDFVEEEREKLRDSFLKRLESYLGIMENQVRRCQSVTNSLLSFTRIPGPGRDSFDLNGLLKQTTELVVRLTDKDPRIRMILDERIPVLMSQPNQLQQVFVNLLNNALRAIHSGGEIILTTRLEGDGNIRIEFKDSGCGIPLEIIDRIFDPFFTTRPEGTGLGLSISHYIIQQMNGNISVESSPGRGSTFTVTIPIPVSSTTWRQANQAPDC